MDPAGGIVPRCVTRCRSTASSISTPGSLTRTKCRPSHRYASDPGLPLRVRPTVCPCVGVPVRARVESAGLTGTIVTPESAGGCVQVQLMSLGLLLEQDQPLDTLTLEYKTRAL